ncbi:MAG: Fur family transcriptional regulator [Planctomycetaceae bacterium]|nr:MAG: Fur family transcriptional regulator [Planctomycetaceae bacterium]
MSSKARKRGRAPKSALRSEQHPAQVTIPPPPSSTVTNPSQVDRLRLMLKSVGLRHTAARVAVLHVLLDAQTPLSHAEIAQRLAPYGYDKATIFRNLSDMVDAGLLTRTELGDHVWRFEFRRAADDAQQHPHFVCVDCGHVTCLHDVPMPQQTSPSLSEVGQVTEILLKGHCRKCEAK